MKNAHLCSKLHCYAAAGLLCFFFGSTLNASEASRSARSLPLSGRRICSANSGNIWGHTTKQGIALGATATAIGIRNGLRLRGGISRVSDSFHGLPMCV